MTGPEHRDSMHAGPAFRTPHLPANFVPRPGTLIGAEHIARATLVFVHAPAGYGKTTWMICQAAALRDAGYRVVWYCLDEHDDGESFVAHLGRGLDDALGHGDDHRRTERWPGMAGTARILELLASIREPIAIFLDDVDASSDASLAAAITQLVNRLPGEHAVFVASRSRPPLRLARARAQSALLDVDVEVLAFGPRETGELLRAAGIHSDGELLVAEILAATEGWPVAVCMAVHLVSQAVEPLRALRGFASSNRDIGDFLLDEIFSRIPATTQSVLLELSVLRQLRPRLCDALTGARDSAATLRALCANGLLTVHVGPGDAYRFHRMFRDFLHARLSANDPVRANTLHARAADLLAVEGLFNEAIEHAVASGDEPFVYAFLARHGTRAIRAGYANRIASWSRDQDETTLVAHPGIAFMAAWAHLLARDMPRAKRIIGALNREAADGRIPPRAASEIVMLEVTYSMSIGDLEGGLAFADRYLRAVPREETWIRGAICNMSGYALGLKGEFGKARARLAEGLQCHARDGCDYGHGYSIAYRGLMEAIQGRLNAALVVYERANDIDPDHPESPCRAVVDFFAADVLYEQGRLAEAKTKIKQSLPAIAEFEFIGIVTFGQLTLARLHVAEDDHLGALRILEQAEEEGISRDHPRLIAAVRWEKVRLALMAGALDEAAADVEELLASRPVGGAPQYLFYPEELEATDIGLWRFQIHAGQTDSAMRSIERELGRMASANRHWRRMRLQILKAVALHARGDVEAATRHLREVLVHAQRERFVRSFVDEGRAVLSMLRDIRERQQALPPGGSGLAREYLDAILAAAGDTVAIDGINAAGRTRLSDREAEILRMAAIGLANKAIANQMYLSENTVKWHLRRIFEKLGTHNRTGAIAAARRAGML